MTTSKQITGASVLLSEYVSVAASTDRFSDDEIKPILLGLFGEVGGVMATAKKARREREAYTGYQDAVEEEFGDTLWYLAALCRRLNLSVDDVLAAATANGRYRTAIAASGRWRTSPKSLMCSTLTTRHSFRLPNSSIPRPRWVA